MLCSNRSPQDGGIEFLSDVAFDGIPDGRKVGEVDECGEFLKGEGQALQYSGLARRVASFAKRTLYAMPILTDMSTNLWA